ncbi:response regulator transcription factor [Paenibacillus sp. CAA11]|uniref:response regulator transcription factor n=1 Tax=Paenibacillus sp. CAA11 TaxID=1532905 RepID=UPI001901545D|nr:response regulator transcription factor [Paenibacillus sp. CAA11]
MDIIIADDQEMVRDGLKMILSLYEDIRVVGETSHGQELLELLKTASADVILMDIRMPVMDGIEATRAVKEQYPDIKVIILTTFDEDEYIFNGLKGGASGYILKDSSSKEIIKSILAARDGNLLLNPQVSSKVVHALHRMSTESASPPSPRQDLSELLTPRELEVAREVQQGKSNKAIGEALYLTEGTVKNYVSHILDKLELSSRTELIVFLQQEP